MKGQNARQSKTSGTGPNQGAPTPGTFQNGHRRSNSRHNGSPREIYTQLPGPSAAGNRLMDVLAKSLGKTTIATVSSGARYLGLLQAADAESLGNSALSVVLHKPVLISKAVLDEKSNADNSLPEKLVIQAKDLIDIEVNTAPKAELASAPKDEESQKPVEKVPEKVPEKLVVPEVSNKSESQIKKPKESTQAPEKTKLPSPPPTQAPAPPQAEVYKPPKRSEFRTDKDISSSFQFRERELQRWTPDDDSLAMSLEEPSGNSGAWDQFKVNEEKFGVESTYDEHLYTTKIDKNTKDYNERLERAQRLAREIEGQSTTDRHVLEERGALVDDSGLDEEDKYSGVQNEQPDQRGNELMAALRHSVNASPASQDTAPQSNASDQRGAHYHNDPAILSSSGVRKAPSPTNTVKSAAGSEAQSKPTSIPPKPPLPSNELFRLNAQSEINALREFSANFKVPHKMPNDLLPILAKDKMKQDEILKRQDSPKKINAEPKKEGNRFKLNPKAAAFTPSFTPASAQKLTNVSPNPPKANFGSPQNPSPRIHNQRSHNSNPPGSGKRHHKVTPAEFFGGQDKVPTEKSQKLKIEKFKTTFNMFNAAKRDHEDSSTPVVVEKAFQTPPTWDSTIEENYEDYIKRQAAPEGKSPAMLVPPINMPFMASPMMGMPNASPQMAAHAFPGTPNPKFPVSPMQGQQANMAAQFQQQQMAMMYQMQGGVPPGAHQMMYPPPDPQFMPPGGFMVPGFVGSHSPVGDNVMMGGGSPYAGNATMQGHQGNFNNHQGNRRYNNPQGKRGSNSARGNGGNQ